MYRYLGILIIGCLVGGVAQIDAYAAARSARTTSSNAAAGYVSANTYNNLYPYMNNKMRTSLNPGTTPTQNNAQINTLARTVQTASSSNRRVVPRTATAARAATTTGTTVAAASSANSTTARRVVPRRTTARAATGNVNMMRGVASATGGARGRAVRDDASTVVRSSDNLVQTTTTGETITSARCYADYTECMNDYCQRKDTAYNRCFCSSRLAQIDATYQPAITELVNKILALKTTKQWSDDEMNEYWMDRVGKYTGDNSWTKLDNLLDIDWSSADNRTNGQNAFVAGHSYCAQHLRGCFYMATNLRDAYRSEIARDCASYEQSLQKIKSAAESIVGSYK